MDFEVLKDKGICKIESKKLSIDEFLNFCKTFLIITPLLPGDADVIKVSKNETFGVYDLPWHPEGSWVDEDIITVTYNYKNCEKFPTEFINTNEIFQKYCFDLKYFANIEVVLKNWGRVKFDNYKKIKILKKRDGKFYIFINPKYTEEIINDYDGLYYNLIKKFENRDKEIEKFKLDINIKSNDILIYDNSKIIHTRPKNLSETSFDRELWRITGVLNV